MWKYSTNVCGPYGLWWYEKNNIPFKLIPFDSEIFGKGVHKSYEQWYGGRIDCYCNNVEDPDYDHYNQELSLPIMRGSSLVMLDKWLESYKSDFFNRDLLKTFEEETGFKLELFEEGMYS
jgi:hypothetical protein